MGTTARVKASKKVVGRKKPIRTYDAALRYLFGHTDYEQMVRVRYNTDTFNLNRVKQLLRKLGDPHKKIKSVHIAGTHSKTNYPAGVLIQHHHDPVCFE